MNVPYDCGVCTKLLDKWCKPDTVGKATIESGNAEHLAREKSTRHLSAEMRWSCCVQDIFQPGTS